jgi:hypothetical protein
LYRVEHDPAVVEQLDALPLDALTGYAQAHEVMGLVPWNGRPYNRDKPDGNMRELVFGPGGRGTVTYLILEDQQRVDVLLVQWAG